MPDTLHFPLAHTLPGVGQLLPDSDHNRPHYCPSGPEAGERDQ